MKKWLIGGSVVLILLAAAVLIPQGLAQAATTQLEDRQEAVASTPWGGELGMEDCPMHGGGLGPGFGQGFGGGYGALDSVTLTRIAQLLGLTPLQVQIQLAEGKSLAQIAESKGVTKEELVTTILAPRKEHLQVDVKYGNLTQAESDQLTIQAQQRVLNQITFAPPVTPGRGIAPGARGYRGQGPSYGAGRGGMMGGGPGPGFSRGGMRGGGMMGGGRMGGRGWR